MAQIVSESGSGESPSDAVKVVETDDYSDRNLAEYSFVAEKYGQMFYDWWLMQQSLVQIGEKKYDVLELKLRDGFEKKVYFDVTELEDS